MYGAIPTFLLGSGHLSQVKVRRIKSVRGVFNGVAFVEVSLFAVCATLSNQEPLTKLCDMLGIEFFKSPSFILIEHAVRQSCFSYESSSTYQSLTGLYLRGLDLKSANAGVTLDKESQKAYH
jgi:hypothetical protein